VCLAGRGLGWWPGDRLASGRHGRCRRHLRHRWRATPSGGVECRLRRRVLGAGWAVHARGRHHLLSGMAAAERCTANSLLGGLGETSRGWESDRPNDARAAQGKLRSVVVVGALSAARWQCAARAESTW
jgi:hypothetical protein